MKSLTELKIYFSLFLLLLCSLCVVGGSIFRETMYFYENSVECIVISRSTSIHYNTLLYNITVECPANKKYTKQIISSCPEHVKNYEVGHIKNLIIHNDTIRDIDDEIDLLFGIVTLIISGFSGLLTLVYKITDKIEDTECEEITQGIECTICNNTRRVFVICTCENKLCTECYKNLVFKKCPYCRKSFN